jgi:hypothetical protein
MALPQRSPPMATTPSRAQQPPPSPLTPTRAAAAAASAYVPGTTIVPSHVRQHVVVVAERDALELVHPPGFPIDVALEPFLVRAAGDRERAVVDAVIATRQLVRAISRRGYTSRGLCDSSTREEAGGDDWPEAARRSLAVGVLARRPRKAQSTARGARSWRARAKTA